MIPLGEISPKDFDVNYEKSFVCIRDLFGSRAMQGGTETYNIRINLKKRRIFLLISILMSVLKPLNSPRTVDVIQVKYDQER
jgi:hypothetical protein